MGSLHDLAILRVPEEMLISFESDVKLVSKVAEGGGGAVWRAELLSETLQSTHKCKSVAVKVLKRKPLWHTFIIDH